jgi:hypothetical protein
VSLGLCAHTQSTLLSALTIYTWCVHVLLVIRAQLLITQHATVSSTHIYDHMASARFSYKIVCVWILRCSCVGREKEWSRFWVRGYLQIPNSAARTPCSVFFIAPPGEFSHFPLRLWAVNSHFARFHMCQAAARDFSGESSGAALMRKCIRERGGAPKVCALGEVCLCDFGKAVVASSAKSTGKVILWPKRVRWANGE